MSHPRAELVEKYLRTCWIIKIRLMSSRRQLWDSQISMIHLENACLQMRKICEGAAQLCLIAADIDYDDIPSKVRKKYGVGNLLNYLRSNDRLNFICRSRVTSDESDTEPKTHRLNIESSNSTDETRLISVFNQCGNVLHERSPYKAFPENTGDAKAAVAHDRNNIRGDHQWLWNFLWQHAIRLKDSPVFFLDFREIDEPPALFS